MDDVESSEKFSELEADEEEFFLSAVTWEQFWNMKSEHAVVMTARLVNMNFISSPAYLIQV